MLFSCEKKIEIILRDVTIRENPTIHTAHLVSIHGQGKLTARACSVEDSCYGSRYFSQILLNDTPLVQVNSPDCPTCSGLLATGYGLANTHCEELESVQNALNEPFESLDRSIAALSPLLSLVESGLYLIADAECYPTDGNGNFFWDVPNQPTPNPATAEALLVDSGYACVSGHPVFLFPTQDTDCFDENRVDYYVDLFTKEKDLPRAVIYNFDEFISFVLDGHHKTCAAALLGEMSKCIAIIPYSGYGYHQSNNQMVPDTLYFASVEIPANDIPKAYLPPVPDWRNHQRQPEPPHNFHITAGTINHRNWEKKYRDAASCYPSVTDYAKIIAANIPCDIPVSEELIDTCLSNLNEEAQQKMQDILLVMKKQNDSRIKQTALCCAKKFPSCPLKEQACRILANMRDDPEIEQYFIDYWVDHSDKHDPTLAIINTYWES